MNNSCLIYCTTHLREGQWIRNEEWYINFCCCSSCKEQTSFWLWQSWEKSSRALKADRMFFMSRFFFFVTKNSSLASSSSFVLSFTLSFSSCYLIEAPTLYNLMFEKLKIWKSGGGLSFTHRDVSKHLQDVLHPM